MDFELKNALMTLETRTPEYFIREALEDRPLPPEAAATLKDLGSEPQATRKLIEMLSLY
jgi:hypothetical protein